MEPKSKQNNLRNILIFIGSIFLTFIFQKIFSIASGNNIVSVCVFVAFILILLFLNKKYLKQKEENNINTTPSIKSSKIYFWQGLFLVLTVIFWIIASFDFFGINTKEFKLGILLILSIATFILSMQAKIISKNEPAQKTAKFLISLGFFISIYSLITSLMGMSWH